MVCRDPNGRGYGTTAPEWTAGPGRAACVLPRHNAWAKDVDSPFGLHHPNRKCSHFSWVRGPLARIVQCAVGTHRLAHQHAIEGAGLKPAPSMHAVTGMIGETTTGERVRIAPGSAGRWPVWCSARVEPIVWRISTPWWGRFETRPHYACGDGYDRRDNNG